MAWSLNADGRDTLFFDGMIESAAVLDCPNMHNDLRAFLKLGIYRHPEIATDNWIYLNDLTITTQDNVITAGLTTGYNATRNDP